MPGLFPQRPETDLGGVLLPCSGALLLEVLFAPCNPSTCLLFPEVLEKHSKDADVVVLYGSTSGTPNEGRIARVGGQGGDSMYDYVGN